MFGYPGVMSGNVLYKSVSVAEQDHRPDKVPAGETPRSLQVRGEK